MSHMYRKHELYSIKAWAKIRYTQLYIYIYIYIFITIINPNSGGWNRH